MLTSQHRTAQVRRGQKAKSTTPVCSRMARTVLVLTFMAIRADRLIRTERLSRSRPMSIDDLSDQFEAFISRARATIDQQAIAILDGLLAEFPFVDLGSRSAALTGGTSSKYRPSTPSLNIVLRT